MRTVGMGMLPLAMLVAALVLSGCVSSAPPAGAEPGRVYSLDEFEEVLLEEKARILEAELKRVRYFGLSGEREVALSPLFPPRYPLLAEWMRVRSIAREGDEVREYHHGRYTAGKDGAEVPARHGYALVRRGRVIAFMPANASWPIEY